MGERQLDQSYYDPQARAIHNTGRLFDPEIVGGTDAPSVQEPSNNADEREPISDVAKIRIEAAHKSLAEAGATARQRRMRLEASIAYDEAQRKNTPPPPLRPSN